MASSDQATKLRKDSASFSRKFGYRLSRLFRILVKGEVGPVLEWHHDLDIRIDPVEVVALVQLKITHRRRVFDHHVVDGVTIHEHARKKEIFCGQPASDFITPLKDRYFQAGFGQIACRCQSVRAAADYDPIEFKHDSSFRQTFRYLTL